MNVIHNNNVHYNVIPSIFNQKSLSKSNGNISPIPQLTLLIVSRNLKRIAYLTNLFEKDFALKVVNDGKTGFTTALRSEVDLILVDIDVPIISGLEMCQLLNNSPLTQDIPIMLMSMHPSSSEEEACLQAGAADYFAADVSPRILYLRVKNCLDLVKKHKELAHLSNTDGLTGLCNRMQLDFTLNHEWQAANRGNDPISIIIADIDQFKLYNDFFGHIKGDECLKKIANAISLVKRRAGDLAARFRGEEFVLLLPETDLEGAERVAESLLNNVRQLHIRHADTATNPIVTLSAGLATHTPNNHRSLNISPIALLEKADMNLYKAKNSGRDRWC